MGGADKVLALACQAQQYGEGRWTAHEAVELGIPTPVMMLALMERFASQGNAGYANRLLACLRQSFGGHAIRQDETP